MEFKHSPVLLGETIEALRIRPEGVYADGTLGGGGHSLEICKRLGAKGRLFGFDRDADAIAAAQKRLKGYEDRVTVIRGNYSRIPDELMLRGITCADGILLDLGVSSYQLDAAERGFSYMHDAPLDMRMDQRQERDAAYIVNTYAQEELFHVIRDYGEERFAGRIARNICRARDEKTIRTTGELARIVKKSIPAKKAAGGHPAKKTFQAIRIEVNSELKTLEGSLDKMIDILSDGGRICIITFHSLEDRIVKNAFKRNEDPCTCPPDFPVCVCGKKPKGVRIGKKPITPSEKEIQQNIRSHSAKLRVFERRFTEEISFRPRVRTAGRRITETDGHQEKERQPWHETCEGQIL